MALLAFLVPVTKIIIKHNWIFNLVANLKNKKRCQVEQIEKVFPTLTLVKVRN